MSSVRFETSPDRSLLLRGGLCVLVPLLVLGVAAGRLPLPALALVALALAVVLATLADSAPERALLVAVAVVAIVPFYDGRLVTRAVGITPMGASCLILLPTAWALRDRVRFVPLDAAFVSLVLLRSLALVLNFAHGRNAVFTVLLQEALPYIAFRLLTTNALTLERMAPVVFWAAIPLSGVGIAEHAGVVNPFFTLLPADYQAAQWARPETRENSVRAEASFGHPIAFGMFLAVALILGVALALTVRSTLQRVLLLAGSGLILLALADTLARGPLLIAAAGVVVWVLVTIRRLSILRVVAVTVVVVGVVVATPVLSTVQQLINASTNTNSREGASTQYRFEILDVALDPAEFSLLGKQTDGSTSVTDAVFAQTGLVSIDSEFAVTYLTDGLLTLLAFLAVILLILRTPFLPGLTALERAWAIAMTATALNLLTVALLTQDGELFWGWTAMMAGLTQRRLVGTSRLLMAPDAVALPQLVSS